MLKISGEFQLVALIYEICKSLLQLYKIKNINFLRFFYSARFLSDFYHRILKKSSFQDCFDEIRFTIKSQLWLNRWQKLRQFPVKKLTFLVKNHTGQGLEFYLVPYFIPFIKHNKNQFEILTGIFCSSGNQRKIFRVRDH